MQFIPFFSHFLEISEYFKILFEHTNFFYAVPGWHHEKRSTSGTYPNVLL